MRATMPGCDVWKGLCMHVCGAKVCLKAHSAFCWMEVGMGAIDL
jgi:hypothetical protein